MRLARARRRLLTELAAPLSRVSKKFETNSTAAIAPAATALANRGPADPSFTCFRKLKKASNA